MPREIIDVPLTAAVPGNDRSVRFVRYGSPDVRPKVYIQAALHADEAPGLLVAHHLIEQLDAADARGEIRGQIVISPFANPLGLAQFVNGDHLGRFDLTSGRNFNRGWPDLAPDLISRLEHRLGSDHNTNLDLIRSEIRKNLEAREAASQIDSLYTILAEEAFDADLVLDLHCDDEGLMHLFVHPGNWSELSDLASELGCHAVFAQRGADGGTFVEACVELWLKLVSAFPDKAIPLGCVGATVELRGFIDIDDKIAHTDAAALITTLRRRGYLDGPISPIPDALCDITEFGACDIVRTPDFGVIVYHVALGEQVSCGQPIADIVNPSGIGRDARTTVYSRTDGIVLTRKLKKLVAAGQVVAKIAGEKLLPHRAGYLLED